MFRYAVVVACLLLLPLAQAGSTPAYVLEDPTGDTELGLGPAWVPTDADERFDLVAVRMNVSFFEATPPSNQTVDRQLLAGGHDHLTVQVEVAGWGDTTDWLKDHTHVYIFFEAHDALHRIEMGRYTYDPLPDPPTLYGSHAILQDGHWATQANWVSGRLLEDSPAMEATFKFQDPTDELVIDALHVFTAQGTLEFGRVGLETLTNELNNGMAWMPAGISDGAVLPEPWVFTKPIMDATVVPASEPAILDQEASAWSVTMLAIGLLGIARRRD